MNAIGGVGYDWGLNRNLWIFIRNAFERDRIPRPLLREPVSTPSNDAVREKDGHIDLQA
jgi:hypothetical protein